MSGSEQPPVRTDLPEPEREPDDGPRIYVASLSDYNAGVLHGVWLDASDDVDELQAGIDRMLAESPTTRRYGDIAEEWAIHDYEGWENLRLGEYEPLERLNATARGIRTHGPAFGAWVEALAPDTIEDEAFLDCFAGEYESLTDYGEHLLEESGLDVSELPGLSAGLRPYVHIDVDAWTRDMELGGDISTVTSSNGGIYVFYNY